MQYLKQSGLIYTPEKILELRRETGLTVPRLQKQGLQRFARSQEERGCSPERLRLLVLSDGVEVVHKMKCMGAGIRRGLLDPGQ